MRGLPLSWLNVVFNNIRRESDHLTLRRTLLPSLGWALSSTRWPVPRLIVDFPGMLRFALERPCSLYELYLKSRFKLPS